MYQIFLDKNLNPRLCVWMMSSSSFTKENTQTNIIDGVLVLDQLLTISEAKQKFAKSEAEASIIENKLKYAVRTGKITYEKGSGKTDPLKIKYTEIENYLSETQDNLSGTQVNYEQNELVRSLREANESLKSQLEFLQKQLEKKDEQIEKLMEGEIQSKELLQNQQSLTLLLEQKSASQNQSKKGFWSLFNGNSQN